MRASRSMIPLLAALFLDLFGFGMVIADFQLRAEKLMPSGWPVGPIIGLMLASTFAIQVFVSPLWGRAGDRLGRKAILLACSALSAAAMLTYGLADSIGFFLLSRVLAGLGGANVAIAQAITSDAFAPEDRTAAIGKIGAAVSAGLILGPVAGGVLAHLGQNHLVGLVAAAASATGWVVLALALPASKTSQPSTESSTNRGGLTLLRDFPALKPFVLIATVSWFAISMLEGTFARLIEHLYGYDQSQFGFLFGFEGLVGVVVQAFLLGWIVRRVAGVPLLRIAFLVQGVGLALNPFAAILSPPIVLLGVASLLFAIGMSIANPTINATCSELTPSDRQGELFGILQSSRSIGFLAGPLIGGLIFDWQPAVPYVVAGLVCVAAAVLTPSRLSALPDPANL